VVEIELGFHTTSVLVIRLSKDGYFGVSGGLDNYVALWNAQKKILLSKISIPDNCTLKAAAINLNGEEILFANSANFTVYCYHHFSNKKQVDLVSKL